MSTITWLFGGPCPQATGYALWPAPSFGNRREDRRAARPSLSGPRDGDVRSEVRVESPAPAEAAEDRMEAFGRTALHAPFPQWVG
jgi:hypothetical protein